MSQLFVEEAAELLTDFEQALLLLESLPDDAELLNRVFRCAHTLKGNSKILGLDVIAGFTHELENLLDRLRKHELMVTRAVADTLLASYDVLKALVGELDGGPRHDPAMRMRASQRIEALVADIHASISNELQPRTSQLPPLEFPPLEATPTIPRDGPAMAMGGLIGASEPPAPPPSAEPRAASIAPRTVSLRPKAASLHPKIASLRPRAQDAASIARASAKAAARGGDGESNSVRVPIDKLDRLINVTGEVVIAQSMLAQLITDELTPDRISSLQEIVAQMDRHCRELQERMLGARMLPIKNVFSRFNRLVRDLSAATGKALALSVEGEETELDKTVIEKIADPLTHLVRNAIDHGVELPDERRAAGKPEQAQLRLHAYQKSGNIFIDVSDDGRGLNHEKILAKARKVGLLASDAQPTDDEINQLIFHPGFSTAEQVTEISGRGVGMDVVKRNVEALRGSISIMTTPGRGTCFRIKLPLTMAILDGLGLRVGNEVYLIPLVAVVESLQPNRSEVRTVANLGEVVEVRGEYLPLIRLYELFGLTPQFASAHEGLVMVIDDGVQRIALQIDELIGQYQVVIKSLETNFAAVPGVAGATILGDGRVALILDTANLMSLARNRERPPGHTYARRVPEQLTGSAP